MNAAVTVTGADLDLAVALAGEEWKTAHRFFPTMTLDPTFIAARIVELQRGRVCMLEPRNPMRQDPQEFSPSTDWRIGGAIVDREHIAIQWRDAGKFLGERRENFWLASCPGQLQEIGATALEAAMRAFVAFKTNATTRSA